MLDRHPRARAAGRSAPTWTPTCPAAPRTATGSARRRCERLAERGTHLLLTADCAITAVDEVAQARALGLDVVVTDHHSPRADGVAARCADRASRRSAATRARTCAPPASPTSSRPRCWRAPGAIRRGPTRTSTSSPWPPWPTASRCATRTAASCARACTRSPTSRKPGIRALLRVAKVDPGALDARAIGFRLAPRINAAGRLYRADAGLELVLTDDRRARRGDRRRARPRQRRAAPHRDADPLRGRGAGARARRAARLRARRRGLAPRGHRDRRLADRRAPSPPVRDARAGRRRGDRLGALDPGLRPARRARRERRAPAAPRRAPRRGGLHDRAGGGRRLPRRLRRARGGGPRARGPRAHRARRRGGGGRRARPRRWPRSSSGSRPSGSPTRRCRCSCRPRAWSTRGRWARRAATCASPSRPAAHRARAVAFGMSRLPDGATAHDATFTLELNEWNGAVEPRLVLRHAQAPAPAAVALVGEPEDPVEAALAELAAPLPVAGADVARGRRPARPPRRRRGRHARRARRLGRAACSSPAPTPRRAARAPRGPPRRLRVVAWARARARPGAHRRATRTSSRSTRRRPTPRPRSSDERFTSPGARRRARTRCTPTKRVRPAPGGRARCTARCATARASARRALARRRAPPARRGPRPARARRARARARRRAPPVRLAPARRTELDASAAFRASRRAWPRAGRGWRRRGAPPHGGLNDRAEGR